MKAYRDNALPAIVILDPKLRRTLTAFGGQPFEERFDLQLDLGSHMPGFVLDVGAIFDVEEKRRQKQRPRYRLAVLSNGYPGARFDGADGDRKHIVRGKGRA